MPSMVQVVDIKEQVGSLIVTGRVNVEAPFFGGMSGKAEDVQATELAKSLVERIELGIKDAIAEQPPGIGKQAAALLAESDEIAWDIRQTAVIAWAFKVRELLKSLT